MPYPKIPLAVRMEKYTDRSDGPNACWPWMRYRTARGYGFVGIATGRGTGAHRVAWEIANGPIPDGMWVLHRCDNPPCCNPAHLFLGTNLDNIADKVAKGRQRGPGPGAKNHQAKLTSGHVAEIRARFARGNVLQRELAAEFGVTQATISRAVRGESWPEAVPPTPANPNPTWQSREEKKRG